MYLCSVKIYLFYLVCKIILYLLLGNKCIFNFLERIVEK